MDKDIKVKQSGRRWLYALLGVAISAVYLLYLKALLVPLFIIISYAINMNMPFLAWAGLGGFPVLIYFSLIALSFTGAIVLRGKLAACIIVASYGLLFASMALIQFMLFWPLREYWL
jgi:hypothetical protein